MVETRRSISLPRTVDLIRPSCGKRRSAILRRAMIFTREVTAGRSAGDEVVNQPDDRRFAREVLEAPHVVFDRLSASRMLPRCSVIVVRDVSVLVEPVECLL